MAELGSRTGHGDASTRQSGRARAPRLSASDRREAILGAAAGFFAEFGFAGTTRALADRIGVRQALLYRYFPSKEALVDAVFQRVFLQRWTADFAGMLADRGLPLEDRLATVYGWYCDQDDGLAIRLFMRAALDGFALPPRRGAMLTSQIFEPLVSELRREEGLPGLDRIPLLQGERDLVTMLHGAIVFHGIREHIYRIPGTDDRTALLALYASTFLAGARSTIRTLHGRSAASTLPRRAGSPAAAEPSTALRRLKASRA